MFVYLYFLYSDDSLIRTRLFPVDIVVHISAKTIQMKKAGHSSREIGARDRFKKEGGGLYDDMAALFTEMRLKQNEDLYRYTLSLKDFIHYQCFTNFHIQVSFRKHTFCGQWEALTSLHRFNHASWVAVVTQTGRVKSAHNRYVIEYFGGLFVLSFCDFKLLVRIGGFVIGIIQIASFSLYSHHFFLIHLLIFRCNFISGMCRTQQRQMEEHWLIIQYTQLSSLLYRLLNPTSQQHQIHGWKTIPNHQILDW